MQAAICTKKILLSHTIVCHLLVNDTGEWVGEKMAKCDMGRGRSIKSHFTSEVLFDDRYEDFFAVFL